MFSVLYIIHIPDELFFFPNYFSISSVFATFAFRIKQAMLI